MSGNGTFRCPTCTGEFPADALEDDACPWCEQKLGEVDQDTYPIATALTREKDDSEQADNPLKRLLT